MNRVAAATSAKNGNTLGFAALGGGILCHLKSSHTTLERTQMFS